MTGMNGPPRRPRDAASRRAALLRAATEVFADVGHAGASPDQGRRWTDGWTDEEFLDQGICRVLFDGIVAARVSP
jgi:hypothetical protein